MDWKIKSRSKMFWVGMFSLIALTGQVFGLYQVPDGWDAWVNAVLTVLTALGVIDTKLKDGE